MEQPPKTIRYHYIKSNEFRTVHADGVVGGVSPKGYLQLSFFSERFPIPQSVDHALAEVKGDQAKIGPEVARVGRAGIVREVEVGVLLDIESAKALREWLTEHIGRVAPREAGNGL